MEATTQPEQNICCSLYALLLRVFSHPYMNIILNACAFQTIMRKHLCRRSAPLTMTPHRRRPIDTAIDIDPCISRANYEPSFLCAPFFCVCVSSERSSEHSSERSPSLVMMMEYNPDYAIYYAPMRNIRQCTLFTYLCKRVCRTNVVRFATRDTARRSAMRVRLCVPCVCGRGQTAEKCRSIGQSAPQPQPDGEKYTN